MRKLIIVGTLVLGLSVLYGCDEKVKPGEHEIQRPLVEGVGIEEVRLTELTDYYETSGTVMAVDTSIVSAKVMGVVKDIRAGVSDRVQKGDILLVIDAPDIQARVDAAQEALQEAEKGLRMAEESRNLMEKTFRRFKKLFEQKAVSGQEFDGIETKRNMAVLQYEMSERSLKRAGAAMKEAAAFRDYTIIRSPVNGVVAEKKIDKGSMTAPGMPLFIIEVPVYRVEVPVDEGMISSVEIGMPADVSIEALNMKTTGSIGEIVRRIDQLTRTFKIKIDIQQGAESLRGGIYATVKLAAGKKSGLLIDEAAIVRRGELYGVYTVNDKGVITMRLIKRGKKMDAMVEVLSGLDEGERIIVKGVEKAVDGGRVR